MKNLFLFLLLLVLGGCSSSLNFEKLPEVTHNNGFSNGRYVEGELVVHINNIHLYNKEELKESNREKNNPANQKPVLKLWSSKIVEQIAQRDVHNVELSIAPTEKFLDNENGNEILYWDLSDSLKEGNSITIKRKFNYTTYDFAPNIDTNLVCKNWNEIPKKLYSFYTKSEPFLILSNEIRTTAAEIVGDEKNPLLKAKLIFGWIRDTMTYVYPPEKRGANEALEKCNGDCGQYSSLFIALARAEGIPARQQSGFNFVPGRTGYHVWSEIYLPVYGWVPVDATRENGFCHLDNKRLIASVGMNIPLRNTPDWATYKNSDVENGVTDFMQLVTIVSSGFDAEISTERNIIHSESLKK